MWTLTKRLTLPQLKRYDTTQRVLESLADAESRAILFSIVKKGKSAIDLAYHLKIPQSSVYKKLADLEELTLVRVEKISVSDKGKKFKTYRSRISKADIVIKKPEAMLRLAPN